MPLSCLSGQDPAKVCSGAQQQACAGKWCAARCLPCAAQHAAQVLGVQACAGPASVSGMYCYVHSNCRYDAKCSQSSHSMALTEVQEYQGLLDDKDRWLHDAVLHGGKPAFTSQFDS